MKVGEIVFHYSTGRKITEFYFSESERNEYFAAYKDALYPVVIPYTGQGVANYLDTVNKLYAATIPQLEKNKRVWKPRHEIMEKNKAA